MYLQLDESEGRRLLSVWINLSPVLLHHVPAAGGELWKETTPSLDQSFPSPSAPCICSWRKVRGGDYSRSGSIFPQSFCFMYLQLEESEVRRLLQVWINLS
jgi:hypothetical protein